MKRYISHESALAYWNFPLAHQYFENEISQAGDRCYTVFDRRDRFTREGVSAKLCSKSLPLNSLVNHQNKWVVSPYFMFLQLAHKYDLHKTILLANLLCARTKGPLSNPAIYKSSLTSFVQEAEGHFGRRKALQALKYSKEGACSIMEVFVDMLISLPVALGGLGITGGVFNFEVELTPRDAKSLGQKRCFVDYCFPEEMIAYEYQGAHHERTIDQDASRTNTLMSMGFSVIPISKSQLYVPEKRAQLLDFITHQHKKRIRTRTPKHEKHLRRIHDLLPRQDSVD